MSDDTRRRVLNMFCRGVLSRSDDDNEDGFQLSEVTLLRDEAKVMVERFQQYGFSAHPPNESECLVLFVGGGRDHGVVFSVDNRVSRLPGQAQGEVSLYTDEGDYLSLMRDHTIKIMTNHVVLTAEDDVRVETKKHELKAEDASSTETKEFTVKADTVTIEAPTIRLVGNVTIEGDLNVTGQTHADTVSLRGHVHTGVQPGTGTSGTPVP